VHGQSRPCTRSSRSAASEPYHFRARIQSFQAFALPFPGDSFQTSSSRLSSKGRADPTGIGGGLKSSKTTIASVWFFRNTNRHRKIAAALSLENVAPGRVSRSAQRPGWSESENRRRKYDRNGLLLAEQDCAVRCPSGSCRWRNFQMRLRWSPIGCGRGGEPDQGDAQK
jgi:hypothetical protein